MMTFTLPTCQRCNSEVTGTSSTVENIFVQGGMEETFHVVTLSCGCVIEFPAFEVDCKKGTQTLKDGFTSEAILTYDDDELIYDDDDYGYGGDE